MEQKTKLYAAIIFVVVIVLVLIYFLSPKPYHPPVGPKEVPTAVVIDEWRVFHAPSERFVVSFPTPPQRAIESVPMPSSEDQIRYDMLLSQSKAGAICMVNIIDYPTSVDVSNADAVLTTVIQEIVAGNQANRLTKKEKVTVQNLPGMEFVIVNEDATIHGLAILKGSSLFVLSAADHDPIAADSVFGKMTDSFHITQSAE